MKRLLALTVCAALLLCALCACRVPPNTKKEKDTMKLLIIGNSHSIDAFHFLYDAFQDQLPEQKITLGVLHFSGCAISTHLQFATHNKPMYTYFLNTDGNWVITEENKMSRVLKDQRWDMVMFQAAKSDLDETLNEAGRRGLEEYVRKYTAEDVRFLWHTSWPSPNEEAFFLSAPEGYKENLQRLYGFDPVNQFTVLTDMAKKHILPDSHYEKAVCTGAAIMHAHKNLGVPQTQLYRDHTHLSDYGRLTVAYAMYAQLTDNAVKSVGIHLIPAEKRHFMFQESGDLPITEEMKQVIIKAANHSLSDPWSIPGK